MGTISFLERQAEPLTRRLERMVGSRETAEDLRQEALLRVWQHGPHDASEESRAAWLWRTASNLAVDELRRRERWAWRELGDAPDGDPSGEDPDERLAVRDALEQLSAHERFVLLLRFEAGLSHAEIGSLVGVSEEAARKRVDRARASFAGAWRQARPDRGPLILLAERGDAEGSDEPYLGWIERAGARVRRLRSELIERDLATADALVLAGSVIDLHPALYRERPRGRINRLDLRRDLTDLRALRAALREGVPVLGVCRGHQLLNIAFGGTLHQDLADDGITRRSHRGGSHRIDTAADSFTRRVLGKRPTVSSEHHQAIARLGRGVIPRASSPDGVVEGAELSGDRFAVGLQWHPESPESGVAGRWMAEALVEAASRRRVTAGRSPDVAGGRTEAA